MVEMDVVVIEAGDDPELNAELWCCLVSYTFF